MGDLETGTVADWEDREDPVPCPSPGCIVEGLNDPDDMRKHIAAEHVMDDIPGSCLHSWQVGMTAPAWHAAHKAGGAHI